MTADSIIKDHLCKLHQARTISIIITKPHDLSTLLWTLVLATFTFRMIIYRSPMPVEIFKRHSTYDNKNNNATYHQRVVYQVFSSVSYRWSNNFTNIFNNLYCRFPYLLLCAVVLRRFQIHILQISLCQKIGQ